MEETSKDLLDDIVSTPHTVQATGVKRLANFLIDYLLFILLLLFAAVAAELISPGSVGIFSDDETTRDMTLAERIITLFLYAMYMFAIEALTKGRSLGKLVTGTKAVNHDGSNISAVTAFKRGLGRMVPFEIFSALGSPSYPWHDKWPRTYVIDIKKSSVLTKIE